MGLLSRELTNAEAKILLTLAKEREKSYTTLIKKKEIAKSNNTIHNSIKNLEFLHLIKSRKGENESPYVRGRKTTYYSLTLFGLLRLIYHFRKKDENKLEIFQKKDKKIGTEGNPQIVNMFKDDVPLVFGQWDHFKKEGVKKIAEKHLVNTLIFCSKNYQHSLENIDDIKDERKLLPLIKRQIEKFKKEKTWAERITGIFLHYGFKTDFRIKNHFVPIRVIPFDEQNKLKNIIQKNELLHLYCLMLSREDANSHTLDERLMYDSSHTLLWDHFTVEKKISDILITKMLEGAGYPDPLYKIAYTALNEDWFSVAFELCNLYKNYTFTNIKEALKAIVRFTQNLAESRIPKIRMAVMQKQIENKEIPKDLAKYLENLKLQTFAAMYFYHLKPIQVWDRTFCQLTPNVERLQQLKENRELAMTEAVVFAHKLQENSEK